MKKKQASQAKKINDFSDKGGRNNVVAKSNEAYMNAVKDENYPKNLVVPLDAPFMDERGSIQNLLMTNVENIAIITSKKDTIRSNHWHKQNWHFLFVIQGEMQYFERDISEEFTDKCVTVKQGQMVFTPPCKVHKTIFLADTVLLSCSRDKKSHNAHEEDLVREEF